MCRTTIIRTLLVSAGLPFICASSLAAEFPKFRAEVIDPNCGRVCYAVTEADVDGDGLRDIVAVTENRVVWYQAPEWKLHTIIEDATERDNVCIAPMDADADGRVDFALGAGWTKIGTIQWLSRGETLDDHWQVHMIGEERWLHRMRAADVLGTGRPQLVISPLNKTVGNGVRLTAFKVPDRPGEERWQPVLLDGDMNRMHNHWHVDRDRDGTIDTLTASAEGVHLIRRDGDGWKRTKIGSGMEGDTPETSGAGEVKMGKLKNGRRYIATVEPMHGTSVAIYTEPASGADEWERHVIEDTLRRGHAVWTADVDRDGDDELVIGHSEPGPGEVKGPGVYVYDPQNDTATEWRKHVIDNGGMATEDVIVADFTADGWPDILAGGRDTHNVKLYVNQGVETGQQE